MYGMVKSALCGGAQYCDQGPLDRAIAQGRFRDDLALIYLCLMDIAAGMTYLHSLGIVHRHAALRNSLLGSKNPSHAATCNIASCSRANHKCLVSLVPVRWRSMPRPQCLLCCAAVLFIDGR